ncbi:polysaccharide deacetylase family protein [Sporosarcina sp. 179-K 3D1 HS]|uniref:polysaccharide deacetylase family protein n=1 Tax=Sporosarcina sp. 179-K 3D1 HS TaxID=3232169 RepID=UPI0039A38EFC
MKKVVVLLILCLWALPNFADASAVKAVKITETTPVFNDKQKVAVFQKGTTHTAIKESDRFYHTVIGNEEVKFSKIRAVAVNSEPQNLKGSHPVRLKTVKAAQILDKPALKAKAIGSMQPNTVLYAQRQKGNYFPIMIGGATGYIHKNEVQIDTGIPVLMYHDIVHKKTDQNVSKLEVAKFQEQMDYLKRNHWTTITPTDLELWVQKKKTLPKKSVLITFDDGYESTILLAYPILKKHGFQATSFIITSRVNRPGMVKEEDLIRTQDVYSYQNHTHMFHLFNTKSNLSYLQSESQEAIYLDILQANQSIEEILGDGSRVTAHAYPYGKRGPQAVRALMASGITSAYTIDEGNVFQGDSLYSLNRQRVHSGMSLKDFADRLEGK